MFGLNSATLLGRTVPALLFAASCGPGGNDDQTCVIDLDCPSGTVCVDGLCESSPEAPDVDTHQDGDDAGSAEVGGATPDARDPDASASDAEDPDASDPDAEDPDASDPDAEVPDGTDPESSLTCELGHELMSFDGGRAFRLVIEGVSSATLALPEGWTVDTTDTACCVNGCCLQ